MKRKDYISEDVKRWLEKNQEVVMSFQVTCDQIWAELTEDPKVTTEETETKIIVKIMKAETACTWVRHDFIRVYAIITDDSWVKKLTRKNKRILTMKDGEIIEIEEIPQRYTASEIGTDHVEGMIILNSKNYEFYLN